MFSLLTAVYLWFLFQKKSFLFVPWRSTGGNGINFFFLDNYKDGRATLYAFLVHFLNGDPQNVQWVEKKITCTGCLRLHQLRMPSDTRQVDWDTWEIRAEKKNMSKKMEKHFAFGKKPLHLIFWSLACLINFLIQI